MTDHLRDRYSRYLPALIHQFPDVDYSADAVGAVANENAYTGFFTGDVALGREFLAVRPGAVAVGNVAGSFVRRGARLDHGLGNVLGTLEKTADIDARPRRRHGIETAGPGEEMFVQFDIQGAGKLACFIGYLEPGG